MKLIEKSEEIKSPRDMIMCASVSQLGGGRVPLTMHNRCRGFFNRAENKYYPMCENCSMREKLDERV